MNQVVEFTKQGAIGVITVNNQPVNALSHAVRQGLEEAITQAGNDDDVKVVVLTAEGRTFIAGADIKEFGKPHQPPALPDVINTIEDCEKPVVAVLHGTPLGGGLEVSLGAHYRVAVPSAKMGLPEIHLGLMPGAGGTQRMPRIIGIEKSHNMMQDGKPLPAKLAHELGLVDEIMDGEPLECGLRFAQRILDENMPVRRTRDREIPDRDSAKEFLAQARAGFEKKTPFLFSPFRIIDALQAACDLEFFDGLAEERKLFFQCMDSPQREGMIHSFFSERAVAKIPESKEAQVAEIKQLGVIGGGTMGTGITTSALMAGFPVVIIERDQPSLEKAQATIASNLEGGVKRGKFSAETRDTWLDDNLKPSTKFSDLSDCDLIIEAVFEELGIKQEVFKKLDLVAKPGAIMASNTSYLDVNKIADVTARPDCVIGLHFFSPAHVMRLLEVVVADRTRPDIVASAFSLAKRLNKVAVRAGVCDGFIGNRILGTYRKQADYMMEDGASPFQIDEAVRGFGFAMGPFETLDLAGQDIGWASRKRQRPLMDHRERYVDIADVVCEKGWFGRKTGRGMYDFSKEHPKGIPNPEIEQIVADARARKGITPREFSSEEIVNRYMCAMINEAAKVVEEGIALRPQDVDVVFVHGYGFPRWRGGPLKYADMRGLDKVLADIEGYVEEDDYFWEPADLLRKLVAEGRNFDDLNKEFKL